MPVDDETRRTLNMIRTSPEKAVLIREKSSSIRIVQPDRIETGNGVYWIYGTTEIETGIELESVFVIDTGDVEGDPETQINLRNYYWWINDNWYPQGDFSGLKRLEIGEDEAFPFRWSTIIPLAAPVAAGAQHHAL